MFYIEGGGWCYYLQGDSINYCSFRAQTQMGSSKFDTQNMQTPKKGILSASPVDNPDFYNWNFVYMRYCDGGSFSGTREETYLDKETGTTLYFRGWYNFLAIVNDVKNRYALSPTEIILSGSSAGGLATSLRCDDMNDIFPGVDVKCINDAGWFSEAENFDGKNIIRHHYENLVNLHRPRKSKYCEETRDKLSCWLPEYFSEYIRNNHLVIQSGYDDWQTGNIWFAESVHERSVIPGWENCVAPGTNMKQCSEGQIKVLNLFNFVIKHSFASYLKAGNHSVFLHNCSCHSHIIFRRWDNVKIKNWSPRDVIGQFILGKTIHIFGGKYGSNDSCDL